jgi:hypothetical protein
MNKKLALLLLPAALVATAALAETGGAADVTAKLQAAGYAEVRDVEFDGGVWEAEVKRADGRWGEVAMDAASGEIFDAKAGKPMLDARGVAEALEAAGYTEITDLDRDGGLWEAEARDKDGTRVELRLAGHDGRVLSSDVEYDD